MFLGLLECLGGPLGLAYRGELRVAVSCLGICDEVVRKGAGCFISHVRGAQTSTWRTQDFLWSLFS